MEEQKRESKAVMVEKGKVILAKGKPVTQIMLLVKGTARVENPYMKGTVKSGDLMGLVDLEEGKYLYDYVAEEDVKGLSIPISNVEGLKRFFLMGREYKKYTVISMVKQVKELIGAYRALEEVTDKLVANVHEGYQKYLQLCERYRRKPKENKDMATIMEGVPANHVDGFEEEYFVNLAEVPQDVAGAFFNANEFVAYAHAKRGADLAKFLHETNTAIMKRFKDAYQLYIDTNENNLFAYYYMLGLEVIEGDGNQQEVLQEVERMVRFILEVKGHFENALNISFPVDKKRMDDVYTALKSSTKEEAESGQLLTTHSKDAIDEADRVLDGSLKKILEYSGIGKEGADSFEKNLAAYQNLADPDSSDDAVRKLRRELSKGFYVIYEKVFLNSLQDAKENRLIQMFLDYGFMDEKMVDKETAMELYFLQKKEPEGGRLSVFTISEWLRAIYEGRREPSKSSFDLDYTEHLRDRKKRKEITEKEEAIYLSDGKMKVRYEIENMFTSNNRVTNGKLSVFCPVLKQADFIGTIANIHLTREKIEKAVDDILKIDFSAFHRECMYRDAANNVEKAYIQKQVFPDFILMPNVGENGIMWQEISDRKRDAPGRFVLPALLVKELDGVMAYMVGCFRWELCRTIQGMYWNDIREKSLTSEYSDYIQFFRKNKDLSEEAREKLKAQVQKCRNRTREVFAKDYDTWIRYECAGSVRLNKVARMILATYCPFAKEYRDKLANQPMYMDAMARYEREHQKEIKRIRNMYAAVRGNGGKVTPVMEENMKFLEEM